MFSRYGVRSVGTHSNLWLVYSVKTGRDWVLPSDRQLVHWLMFLEVDPAVKTFDAAPDIVLSVDEKEVRATQLDAVVTYLDGHVEWHEVKAGSHRTASHRSQLAAQAAAASAEGVRYRIFDDDQLSPVAGVAIRWLSALSHAVAIRDSSHLPTSNAACFAIDQMGQGTVRQLLAALQLHPAPIALGVLVELAVKGVVELDLDSDDFGYNTRWAKRGGA